MNGTKRRHEEALRAEEAAETAAMLATLAACNEALEADYRKAATVIAETRAIYASLDHNRARLARLHTSLEARGVPPRELTARIALANRAIGTVPTTEQTVGRAATEFGRREDRALFEILHNLTNGRDVMLRRQDNVALGRAGETRGARSQILNAYGQQAHT